VSRLSLRRSTNPLTTDDLLGRWAAALRGSVGVERMRRYEPAADLVEQLLTRPCELDGALGRFGRRVGAEGWALSEVASWLDVLADVAGPAGAGLRDFGAGIAVAKGWAEGFLHGANLEGCVDPLTGLATLPVLELRLRQIYDQCAALGVEATQAFGLIVVDADLAGRPPLVREAARVVLADRVTAAFHDGETVAEAHGPIVVLASRTSELADRVADLEESLGSLAVLGGAPLLIWVEPLPADASQLTEFVLDLARA
jgi:hypothetical protein